MPDADDPSSKVPVSAEETEAAERQARAIADLVHLSAGIAARESAQPTGEVVWEARCPEFDQIARVRFERGLMCLALEEPPAGIFTTMDVAMPDAVALARAILAAAGKGEALDG